MTARAFGKIIVTYPAGIVPGPRRFNVRSFNTSTAENTYKMRGWDTSTSAYVFWYTTNPNTVSPYASAIDVCIDAVIVGDDPTEL